MPVEGAPERLSIVVYDGHYDKVHYALAMASSAAAINTRVSLFFTMDACRALARPGPDGTPAWRGLPVSQGSGTGGEMDDGFRARKIGTFEELLEACLAFDVTFMVCDMGLRARDMTLDDLREDVPVTPGGLVTFFTTAARDGAVVFI